MRFAPEKTRALIQVSTWFTVVWASLQPFIDASREQGYGKRFCLLPLWRFDRPSPNRIK